MASPSTVQADAIGGGRRAQAGAAARRWARRRRVPAWTLTAALGLLYVLLAPASSDLAAAGYRSELFSRAGFTLWDNGWYGGHHLPAYSLLAPPLGALLSPQLVAALSMTAAAALFAALVRSHAPRAERAASLWFSFGAGVELFTNRVTFELGLALGLATLLAARLASARRARDGRRHAPLQLLALALSLLCPLASPVAGAFLALALLAWLLAARGGAFSLLLGAAALVPIALLSVAFPEGGSEPFVAAAFYPTLAGTLALALAVPPRRGALRAGVVLYALVLVACYLLATPVGGNADRLGALLAGPLLAYALIARPPGTYVERRHRTPKPRHWLPRGWRAVALVVLAPAFLYWQLRAPIADYASGASDPATAASYYRPLLAELRRLGVGYEGRPVRIEVPPTRDHAEARFLAAHVALARGWERQLDRRDGGLFYDGALDAARYRAWLAREAVSFVALPDAPLDYAARGEARLLRTGPPAYLREAWRSRHWRLFEVRSPAPLAQPPGTLTRLGDDDFALRAPRAGSYLVRVRFTPYWALLDGAGCVSRGREGFTELQARAAGTLRVGIRFSPGRVFGHGARCR
ncbi:MAG TPA: hypothetical protein VL988_09385 [Solirubrobacteraceae bacterium]|nr:hypothetical protein [Solirubrobacteraceae bacterium]